ncbi:hypothetical protein [Psychromonas antarctica]|jgi:hypothetical protein|uniref:hypothetical protein n=1 Tax=Psychromonas antarctica TaxID=67573 RepID=UPI001EE8D61F|nr:hypothetical protein [Psychromonas antarctica]MCG6202047.1 hypothetical protein [Psychromonas antarctica]
MKKYILTLALTCALFACTEIKSVGTDIGDATKEATTEIGHTSRDVAKKVTTTIGDASRDAVKSLSE